MDELAGVLKALAKSDTSGAALAALAQGRPFSLERLGVLVADARSIVIQLSARELRGRLAQSKELSAEARQWIDQSVRVMEECGPARFENRGGSIAFEQAAAMFAKRRSQLEPFLFQAVPPAGPPPPVQRKGQKEGR